MIKKQGLMRERWGRGERIRLEEEKEEEEAGRNSETALRKDWKLGGGLSNLPLPPYV